MIRVTKNLPMIRQVTFWEYLFICHDKWPCKELPTKSNKDTNEIDSIIICWGIDLFYEGWLKSQIFFSELVNFWSFNMSDHIPRKRECMTEGLIWQLVSFNNLLDQILIKIVCSSTAFRCRYLHVRYYPFYKWSFPWNVIREPPCKRFMKYK